MIDISDLTDLPIQVFEEKPSDRKSLMSPFIWTDVFLNEINHKPDHLILHLWPMKKSVILGMLDRQLPYFEEAKNELITKGYDPIVRNIGGLAVVADQGILNFSLFIPNVFQEKLSISNAYLMMVQLIKATFSDFYQNIDYFEIEESYCPGNYDLSIDGRKFAGIAQRRIKNGIVVSIYLSVEGDQEARGQLISEFYKTGKQNLQTKVNYPVVDPRCMGTLSDLLLYSFTVCEVIDRLKLSLRQMGFKLEEKEPDRNAYLELEKKIQL